MDEEKKVSTNKYAEMDKPKRAKLGFIEAVRKHFAFLENEFGFTCELSDVYQVRYETEKVYFSIWHEHNSYEMYFVAGLMPNTYENKLRAHTATIIDMAGLEQESFYSAWTKEEVEISVKKLADFAKKYAIDAITGSEEFYDAVAKRRQWLEDNIIPGNNPLRLIEEIKQKERKNNRLKDYDYSQKGAYFITICTKDRENLLCKIVGEGLLPQKPLVFGDPACTLPQTELTEIGYEIEKGIRYIKDNYYGVHIEKYIIMPNHFHMIVIINKDAAGDGTRAGGHGNHTGGDGTPPLQDIIGRFKSYTTRRYNEVNHTENKILWQRSFHDHIIRNEQDYLEVWNYIDTNPLKRYEDKYNV